MKTSTQETEIDFSALNRFKIEPLIPQLQAGFVGDSDDRVPGIYTKFFHTVLVPPQMYKLANETYLHREKKAREALENEKWTKYILLHERPYQIEALCEVAEYFECDNDFLEAVIDCWVSVENTWQLTGEFNAFVVPRLTTLPQEMRLSPDVPLNEDSNGMVTLYRGYCALRGTKFGMSYTTSLNKAKWFSRRLSDIPRIVTVKIPKESILFTTNSRNEMEVVANAGAEHEIRKTHE